MSLAVMCPRCGGEVRPPDLMHTDWRCATCGAVSPWHVAHRISAETLTAVVQRLRGFDGDDGTAPLWCPWPLLPAFTVTGVGWAGEERTGPTATAVTISGPAPISAGPADLVFVSEEPGVGLGNALAGLPGEDPGEALRAAAEATAPHAKVKAAGHPTPLWAVPSLEDRCVYVGEARARWLYVIIWPAAAGYLLADDIALHDLVEALPTELVFGATSSRLWLRAPLG